MDIAASRVGKCAPLCRIGWCVKLTVKFLPRNLLVKVHLNGFSAPLSHLLTIRSPLHCPFTSLLSLHRITVPLPLSLSLYLFIVPSHFHCSLHPCTVASPPHCSFTSALSRLLFTVSSLFTVPSQLSTNHALILTMTIVKQVCFLAGFSIFLLSRHVTNPTCLHWRRLFFRMCFTGPLL